VAAADQPWKKLYDFLSQHSYGTLVSYTDILAGTGLDLQINRAPVSRARSELESVDQKTLEAARNKGYRIVEPSQHLRLANGHRQRSARQMGRAVEVAQATNVSLLSPEDARIIRDFSMWAEKVRRDLAWSHQRHDDMERRMTVVEVELDRILGPG